jgi:hypothetical protein
MGNNKPFGPKYPPHPGLVKEIQKGSPLDPVVVAQKKSFATIEPPDQHLKWQIVSEAHVPHEINLVLGSDKPVMVGHDQFVHFRNMIERTKTRPVRPRKLQNIGVK